MVELVNVPKRRRQRISWTLFFTFFKAAHPKNDRDVLKRIGASNPDVVFLAVGVISYVSASSEEVIAALDPVETTLGADDRNLGLPHGTVLDAVKQRVAQAKEKRHEQAEAARSVRSVALAGLS